MAMLSFNGICRRYKRWLGRCDAVLGDLEIGLVALDADEPATCKHAGYTSCVGVEEWVQH